MLKLRFHLLEFQDLGECQKIFCQSRPELHIVIIKKYLRKHVRESNSPMVLWDYAIERRDLIHNAIPHPLFQAQGKTPHECTFCDQGDMSNV